MKISTNCKNKKVKCICKQCDNEFYVKPSVIKNSGGKFCSRKCMGEWYSDHNIGKSNPNYKGGKIKCICQQCNKEFERYPSDIKLGLFCSNKCQGEWKSEHLKGKNNPLWKPKIKQICEQCGTEFFVKPSRMKRGTTKFCSRECARHARRFIKHHTKPELIFEEICKKYNLPFKYTGDGAFWIGKKPSVNPDFVECNGKKIAVEIFSYWHDPLRRLGKVPYSGTYKGRKEILKRYGWRLVVFWDADLLREDAEQFVLNTLKRINY